MKPSSLSLPSAAIALLTAVVFAAAAQAPQSPPPEGRAQPPRSYPAPTHLKVLPKHLTGQQVHEIMEGWAGSLGVHCDYCHAADPKKVGPNGRPQLNFADDSKPDKAMARIMYTMTENLKKKYVAKVEAMDKMGVPPAPVTCGTCHRGHEDPEPFVIPREGGMRRPEGTPPAGEMPPMQH